MAWKIWKSDAERFEEEYGKALNERNKGNLDGAVEHFNKAAEIASASGDQGLKAKGALAAAMASIYSLVKSPSEAALKQAMASLRSLNPEAELDLALPYRVKAGELYRELEALSAYLTLPRIDIGKLRGMKPGELDELSKRYEEAAGILLQYGRDKFLLEDLLKLDTPQKTALRLLALSRLMKAVLAEREDPGRAVELYTEAVGYLSSIADQRYSATASKWLEKAGKSTKCWICGRDMQGEDVHFVYLPATITPYIAKRYGEEAPNMLVESGGGQYIAVCTACYTAMYNLGDAISRHYYELAMKALEDAVRRLQMEIDALRNECRARWVAGAGRPR
ncbi:hypothetical protein [Desulfurococcus mucosus]|uniref:Uncharacterized protein n=1 Tax=Desulfurococcus mucosus (strain ATCC 35584 / DSM 2162 / JCM 9187 / O7/1) TaxID=765177 RepID=E8R8M2_DESM0|nr:hypothetical protein [Desulfurococcus mucosus]ADV64848.1 hypothetical protein Desmu_0538 [Desulfurococcus mucosus DSM 2162]